ncbi:MAG: hypothetical protein PG981_000940 [Wolbachia endosymbiont of Ctenocephalides orientis wCori]|nr:MAG: hypothetical protein PG981_000940 [Wolbachia endosymbiont of Ctenocephalides orientis wCori]
MDASLPAALKLEYAPSGGGTKVEHTINGLASALSILLNLTDSQGKSVLAAEVAKPDVVDILVPALATVGTDDTKKVYTKKAMDDDFLKTSELPTQVAEVGVTNALASTFADKDHTHPAISPGQSANSAPLPQPASPAPIQLDLSSLKGLATDDTLPGDWINM